MKNVKIYIMWLNYFKEEITLRSIFFSPNIPVHVSLLCVMYFSFLAVKDTNVLLLSLSRACLHFPNSQRTQKDILHF